MTIAKVSAQEEAHDFVWEFADDNYCLNLLRFFGGHPYARFNRLAILHAQGMDGGKSFLEKALMGLIDQGIVKECVENGFTLYSLTEDEILRRQVMELAKLDWSERRGWYPILHRPGLCYCREHGTKDDKDNESGHSQHGGCPDELTTPPPPAQQPDGNQEQRRDEHQDSLAER